RPPTEPTGRSRLALGVGVGRRLRVLRRRLRLRLRRVPIRYRGLHPPAGGQLVEEAGGVEAGDELVDGFGQQPEPGGELAGIDERLDRSGAGHAGTSSAMSAMSSMSTPRASARRLAVGGMIPTALDSRSEMRCLLTPESLARAVTVCPWRCRAARRAAGLLRMPGTISGHVRSRQRATG